MLLLVGSELKGVHQVQDFTEVVPAVNFVFELGKNLSDFVLNGLGVIGTLFESCEVWEQVAVHKLHQVGTRHGLVMVKLSILAFGTCPHVPAVLFAQNRIVMLSPQCGLIGLLRLQFMQMTEEQHPGGLSNVIEFTVGSCILVQDVINVLECVFKHGKRLGWCAI